MYQYSSYRTKPSRGSYFLPFVSLIIIGLIVVLIFQIVDYFQDRRAKALENKAAVKVVTGRGDMKIWALEEWTNVVDGSILKEGDALRTAPGSRMLLSLLNGSLVRISSETEIELSVLKSRDGMDELSLNLKKGQIWVKASEAPGVAANFSVQTPHMKIASLGTIFSAEALAAESVRVLDGKVHVDILVFQENEEPRVAESLDVALGQEVTLGKREITELQNRRAVDLLALMSDEFRDTEWYSWNRKEDANGTSTITIANALSQASALSIPSVTSIAPPKEEVRIVLSPPEILSPEAANRRSATGYFLVSGKTDSATAKIEITTYIAGKTESYFLQKYPAGSTTWSYVASREYGNLVPGENRFAIAAVGKDGSKSDPAEIILYYDRSKEPADLSAPVVSAPTETNDDEVKVSGKIGKGIVKMWVNDFTLTRYVPDSGTWSYVAASKYGNLKDGENEYVVYGVDFDGNKTPAVKFTIVKKPKPEGAVEKPAEEAPKPAEEL